MDDTLIDIDTRREYRDFAVEAATRAADVLEANFRSQIDVRAKAETELVSEIDLQAEEAILSHVRKEFPSHAILSEESGAAEGTNTDSSNDDADTPRWIIDPLDGTHNYVNGFSHYSVSVAVAVNGRIVAGTVVCPATDDVYSAVRGDGARKNDQELSVSSVETLEESFLAAGISPPATDDEEFQQLLEWCQRKGHTQGIRRLGSGAADLCLVAEGIFDGYVDKYTSPWDVAAGSLIVTEAGGRTTDFEGDDLDYQMGERSLHVRASNGRIHKDLATPHR